jgi:hypothetical protein
MAAVSSLKSSILIASVAAGPLVFGFIVIGLITKQFPEPIDITPLGIAAYFSGSLMACIVGVVVALVATILGSSLVIALGNRLEIARARIVWLIVGAALTTASALLSTPAGPPRRLASRSFWPLRSAPGFAEHQNRGTCYRPSKA